MQRKGYQISNSEGSMDNDGDGMDSKLLAINMLYSLQT